MGPVALGRLRRQSAARPAPEALEPDGREALRRLPLFRGDLRGHQQGRLRQLYWSPDRPTAETVREYVAFEYAPDAVDDLTAAIAILEQNHLRDHIGPTADHAFALIKQAEAKLSPRARSAWRWRILYLRGLIDRELRATRGRLEGDVLRSAFDELTTIYHAENAHSMPIHPPRIRATDTRGMDLSPGHHAAAIGTEAPGRGAGRR